MPGSSRMIVVLAMVGLSCASVDKARIAPSSPRERDQSAFARQIARSADLTVAVSSLSEALSNAEQATTAAGGTIEHTETSEESSAWLALRVPAPALDGVLSSLSELGNVQRRSVSARDVTDEYADLDLRLENNRAFRTRLRELLSQAKTVEEILSVEKELNRLQSEIESQEAQFQRLQSEVAMSQVSLRLVRERVYGPLGYIGYGLWWGISKLFVFR